MGKLLSSGMYRLARSKIFYILLAITALSMVYIYHNTYRLQLSRDFSQLELYFFQFINLNIVTGAVFCPLFLASEYGDGVLRNKLVVGRTRTQIYLSDLLVNCLYGAAATVIAIAAGFCFGMPLLGVFQRATAGDVLLHIGLALTTTWVCIGFYTLLSLVVTNRGIAVSLCILLAFGMIFLGQYLNLCLSQEEVLRTIIYNDAGRVTTQEMPNPAYLTGAKREIYQFFFDLTPGGQAYQILSMNAKFPLRMLGLSGLLFVLTNTLGLVIFQRKDIK